MFRHALIWLLVSGTFGPGVLDAASVTVADATRINKVLFSAREGDVITVGCDVPGLTIKDIHGAEGRRP